MAKQYRVKAFSELTSVTVRTLQYYDDIGLLKPTVKTAAGHRLYSENDLLRLQQISTLKFLGLSLKAIKNIVLNPSFDIKNSLQIQEEMLAHELQRMSKASRLIQYLINSLETDNSIDWKTVINIIEVMQMSQSEHDQWERKFLNADELREFEKMVSSRTAAEWDGYHKQWLTLLDEIKKNMHQPPESDTGQQLAKKWIALVQDIYGDYPQLGAKMWLALKYDVMPKDQFPYNQEVINYMEKAKEHLLKKK